jgi:cobalamin biosynthesis protein CbiD
MTLKEYLNAKGIKQVAIAKATGLEPGRISLHVNEVFALPSKHLIKVADFLGVTLEEVRTNNIKDTNGGVL